MARFAIGLSVLFLFSFGACSHAPKIGDPNIVAITILHTNDIHGHAWPEKDDAGVERGGFAAQAALVQKIWKEVDAKNGIMLVLSGGDVNTGTPDSDILQAEPDITSMNAIGYDAMVLGNHEFDQGIEKILKQKKIAKFPMVSANVRYSDGRYLTDPYTVLIRKDLKIGILGLTAGDLKTLVVAKLMEGMQVDEPVSAAKAHLPKLKEMRPDLIIGLTHLGVLEPGKKPVHVLATDDSQLARAVPEIGVIIGGHSHLALPEGIRINDTLIAQAGSHGTYLGRVDLLFDKENDEIVSATAKLLPVLPSEGEDPALKKMLDAYKRKTAPLLEKQIATATVPLIGERTQIRSHETNLGNLVTDAVREFTKADIALFNGGGIRSGIPKGPVRLRHIYEMLPFQNTVVTAQMSGAQLKEALQTGIANAYPGGGLLHVSGIKYTVENGKVTGIERNGKTIQPSDKFLLATNNFLIEGGNNMEVLTTLTERKDTGVPVDRVVADYFKSLKNLKSPKGGRIEFVAAKGVSLSPPVESPQATASH